MYKFSLALATLVSLALTGCSTQNNPVSTLDGSDPIQAQSHQVFEPTILDNGSDPEFIKQPTSNAAKSIVTATAYVTPSHGGKVDLKSRFYDPMGKKDVEIAFNLKVPRHAVNEPITITMTLDTTNLLANITFEPHGTVFNKPVMFNARCLGLNLDNLMDGDVDVYYVQDGMWTERNVPGKISLNAKKGELVLKDVPMNHFSQYAFGRRQ